MAGHSDSKRKAIQYLEKYFYMTLDRDGNGNRDRQVSIMLKDEKSFFSRYSIIYGTYYTFIGIIDQMVVMSPRVWGRWLYS